MAEYKWYCLRAISGKELKVKELLDAEIEKGDLGKYVQQVVVPTEKVIAQRGEKKIVKEKVLFSSYVFVQCLVVSQKQKVGDKTITTNKIAGEAQLQLTNTTNVVGFLCGRNSKMPESLPDEQIAAMLGNVDEKAEQEAQTEISFIVGETVKVNDGPFKDFDGIVEEINSEKKKLKVMVKIFGRKTPLELNYDQVTKEA
jgi:transcription termination/antitermination protein NusG